MYTEHYTRNNECTRLYMYAYITLYTIIYKLYKIIVSS